MRWTPLWRELYPLGVVCERPDVTGVELLPYWLMFMMWAAGAVQAERQHAQSPRKILFVSAAVISGLMIGLRFEVGGDWNNYKRMYESLYFLTLGQAIATTDIGYAVTNWLGAKTGLGIAFVNSVCAALFMGGLARLAWRQPNPALAVLVAVPYLVIVVAMGYTRQAAAIGIICFAIADASERKVLRLAILISIAALFHKTAILILPLAMVPIFRRSPLLAAFGAATFAILFTILIRDTADTMITNYVQGEYNSQGAAIRISMNVVAAMIFIIARDRLIISSFQKSYWTVCSILSILSVPAFLSFSASSGIDRISLYMIPLQIIIYSRLPYILSKNRKAIPSILIGVIGYSFLVQFVWLMYADNANSWLPYRLSLT